MSKYLGRTREWFEWLQKRVENTENSHHQAVLQNYLSHASLELYGTWEVIFTPEMTVPEPEYHIYGLGYDKLTTFSGTKEVKGFYSRLNQDAVVLTYPYGPIERCIELTDWGFITFMTLAQILSGKQLTELGVEVADKSAQYVAEAPTASRLWYDAEAKLIGEDVYQIAEWTYTKIAPEDDVTPGELHECARLFIPA